MLPQRVNCIAGGASLCTPCALNPLGVIDELGASGRAGCLNILQLRLFNAELTGSIRRLVERALKPLGLNARFAGIDLPEALVDLSGELITRAPTCG